MQFVFHYKVTGKICLMNPTLPPAHSLTVDVVQHMCWKPGEKMKLFPKVNTEEMIITENHYLVKSECICIILHTDYL